MSLGARTGTAYLVGSGERGVLASVVRRVLASAGPAPKVAVSHAAVAGNPDGLRYMERHMGSLFAGATVKRFAVLGETDAQDPRAARAIVEEADAVFLGGGDPALGAKVLAAAGANAWLREARARGAAMLGVSAGAIMLGAFWAEWPPEPPHDAELDGGRLVECTGVVPDLVVDCHDEDSDWDELRTVARMMERAGKRARMYGIPAGGVLVAHGDGSLTHEGKPPFVLNAEAG